MVRNKLVNETPNWLKEAKAHERAGDLVAAEKIYMQQMEREPENDMVLCELAGFACKLRKYDAAMTFANKAVALNPQNALATTYLGVALMMGGHIKQAELCFAKAIDVDPDYPMPLYHLASIKKEHYNDIEGAKELVDRVLAINPNIPNALNLKGVILAEQGWHDEALECYEKALNFGVDSGRVYANIGSIMLERQWFEEAADYFQKAYEKFPDNYEYLSNALLANNKADNFDMFFELLQMAKKMGVNQVPVLRNEASYWIVKGNKEEAKRCAEEMLALNKAYVGAYVVLCAIKKMKAGDAESEKYVKEMELLLEQGELKKKEQVTLLFALGKAYNDIGLYDKAFLTFKRANRHKEDKDKGGDWIKCMDSMITWLRDNISPEFYKEREGFGIETAAPIFIIGMPRSGTSLVEQILSMHSSVTGAGELLYLPQVIERIVKVSGNVGVLYPAVMSNLAHDEVAEHANKYIEKVNRKLKEYERFTDKLPANYEFLGMIRLMFPNAKIIHCCRHPLDTSLSIYFQDFTSLRYYSNSLEDISFAYKKYTELMNIWKGAFPDKIYDLCYERIVENPEAEVRALLEFCGLDWQEDCLEFYKNKRNVNTASHMQVNQPLYKTSKHRWKNYEKHIKSLANNLKDVVEVYEKKWMDRYR